MGGFRLLSYCTADGAARAGVAFDGRVHDGEALLGAAGGSVLSILQAWDDTAPRLSRIAQDFEPTGGIALEACELLAPILYPGAVYCAGANYTDHLIEMTGKPPPEGVEPFFFLKPPASSIVGPGAPIRLPAMAKCVDWEAEIALVVGRRAHRIGDADAMACIAGFTILHDVSARDLMKRDDVPFAWDWLSHKCFASFAPMGPWIVPREDVADPYDMTVKLWVNGEPKQDSNSANLVCGYERLIAWLSERVVLMPGDVIATGTPAGVGMPKGTFLAAGDTVRIEVGGVGVLENPVVAEE